MEQNKTAQINELVDILGSACGYCEDKRDCKQCKYYSEDEETDCISVRGANEIYNAGYRKVSIDEANYWKSRCKEIGDIASKETAREILQPLYDACKEDDYGQVVVDFAILEDLAKRYGVEVK